MNARVFCSTCGIEELKNRSLSCDFLDEGEPSSEGGLCRPSLDGTVGTELTALVQLAAVEAVGTVAAVSDDALSVFVPGHATMPLLVKSLILPIFRDAKGLAHAGELRSHLDRVELQELETVGSQCPFDRFDVAGESRDFAVDEDTHSLSPRLG